MTNVLIFLALAVFVGVLCLLNQFLKRARSEQLLRLWKERQHRWEPDARPHRSEARRSRRRFSL
jgi:hypothetical protein